MLSKNKKVWDVNLRYALWAIRITVKRSIGTSPFSRLYGKQAILPIHLGLPVLKLIQHEIEEQNDTVRRVYEIIELQQGKRTSQHEILETTEEDQEEF